MTIEHKDIADAERHEPKGASTALAGQLLVADGLGGRLLDDEPGMWCPACGIFAGKRVADILERHARSSLKASQRKKKDFGIQRKPVQMYLLIHPEWLKGASGFDGEGELGGWAGASAVDTADWFERRMKNLAIILFKLIH